MTYSFNPNNNNATLEGVIPQYKNFSGKERFGNPDNNVMPEFTIFIEDPTIAQAMANDGFHITAVEADPEYPERNTVYKMKVKIHPNSCTICKINTDGTRMAYNVNTMGTLDRSRIIYADIVVRQYRWTNTNGTGITAYLNEANIMLDESPLELKYAHMPIIN